MKPLKQISGKDGYAKSFFMLFFLRAIILIIIKYHRSQRGRKGSSYVVNRISTASIYGTARDLRNAPRLSALYTFAVVRTDDY